jgi:hypothetical protein
VLLVDDAHDRDPGRVRVLRALAPPDGEAALELFGESERSHFSFRAAPATVFYSTSFRRLYRPAEFRLAPPACADAALANRHRNTARALSRPVEPIRASTGEPARQERATGPAREPTALDSLPLFAVATNHPRAAEARRDQRGTHRARLGSARCARATRSPKRSRRRRDGQGLARAGIAPDEDRDRGA